MYWGIVTINALIAIAGANIAMILFGWLQEKMNLLHEPPPPRGLQWSSMFRCSETKTYPQRCM
ncbi:hypothetical protein E3O19_09575 [Cryobacterium algoritolerans]|uniref:Uncharacterized protein n=1 Tax=Cryobacterium algoritolerans TaxID=1259184 RepID=A0A4R8WVM4_9MICO|nr:hypothetical protein [Cryobacterium algoritolerans]TFC15351.1 hypothetical protein E3O19_09575 [Cryobacterium algoritolerans]